MDSGLSEAIRHDRVVEDLTRLVRCPSVTPEEQRISSLVHAALLSAGVDATLVESLPGRYSIGARISGPAGAAGVRLLLNGHLDTVPAGDAHTWSHPPFGGEVHGGALYGRGACDMKAGLAVMLELARLVAARREQLRGELVLHFAIGEERAEPGTRSLLEAGFGADAGIVLEPTSLRVATAQRGGAAVTVEIRGRAAHAGSPERGASALAPLARVLDAVAARNRELSQLRHPALAAATIIPTVIRAGDTANILPDRCEVVLDLRLVPGMSLAAEVQELRRRLPPLVSDTHIEVLAPECHWQASVTPSERSFEGVVRAALADEGATAAASQAYATPFASDVACLINEGSVEAVTFGPGDIAAAHAADEHVDLGEVATASRTIARVIDRTLFVQPDPSPWTAAQAALDS